MTANEITCDPRLKHLDVRVYNFLAGSRRGAFVTLGERRIAERVHADRRNVRGALVRLHQAGYLETIPGRQSGSRARYRLTSPLFAAATKPDSQPATPSAGLERKTAGTLPAARRAKLATCPKCRRDGLANLLKIGWCRTCNADMRTRKVVREEIERATA